MKGRALTPEEKKLWRESNKHTDRRNIANVEPLLFSDDLSIGPASPISHPPLPMPRRMGGKGASPSSPLRALSSREAKRLFKPYGAVEATLDLHGMNKLAAHALVQEFIATQYKHGRRHVAIITGKGKGGEVGVLRSNLPYWLNEPALRPLISAFAHATPEKGGAGVTHVLVKAR